MRDSTDDEEPTESASDAARARKRELVFAAAGVVVGFVVLPILIFMVGTVLLGPYAGGQSIGPFFTAFYVNLAHGSVRTWLIALAPYLAFWLVRLSIRRYPFDNAKPPQDSNPSPKPAVAQPGASRSRR